MTALACTAAIKIRNVSDARIHEMDPMSDSFREETKRDEISSYAEILSRFPREKAASLLIHDFDLILK